MSGRTECAEALATVWSDADAAHLLAVRDQGRDLRLGLGSAAAALGAGLVVGGGVWTHRAGALADPRQVPGPGSLPGGFGP